MTRLDSGQPGDIVGDSSPVSTGHLPSAERIQQLVDAAYARYKSDDTGRNADHYPALATVPRHLFGVCLTESNGATYAAGFQPRR